MSDKTPINRTFFEDIRNILTEARRQAYAAREFYIREAAEQSWSTWQLERSIKTLDFERRLAAPEKRAVVPAESEKVSLYDFIKDPYVLEFLGLTEFLKQKPERSRRANLNLPSRRIDGVRGIHSGVRCFGARSIKLCVHNQKYVGGKNSTHCVEF